MHLLLVWQVRIIRVHEHEHTLDVNVLNCFNVQNRVVLLATALLTLALTVRSHANLLIALSVVIHVLVLLLLAIDEFRNLRQAAIVSLIRTSAINIGQILS